MIDLKKILSLLFIIRMHFEKYIEIKKNNAIVGLASNENIAQTVYT